MIFEKNQDLKHFHAPWYERIHPFWLAIGIVLLFMLVSSTEWWLQ